MPDGIRPGSKAPPKRVLDIKEIGREAEQPSQQTEPPPPDIEEEQVIETLPPDVEVTEQEAERSPLDLGAAQEAEPLVLDFETMQQEAESPLPYAEAVEWQVEGLPPESEPPEEERETTGVLSKIAALPRQVILLLVIAPILIGLALVGLVLLALFGARSPKAQPEATVPVPVTPTTALLLDLPTSTPTATFEPAATSTTLPPTEEPTAKPTVVLESVAEATLAYDSNLRTGPGVEFDVISPLQAGTKLMILARDWPGLWLLVRTEDGREGWLAASQIVEEDIDIPLLPLAPDIATPPPPAVTATPTE